MARIRIVAGQGGAKFSPDPLTITKNGRVFWLNEDNQDHQISLTGELIKPGETSSEVAITANRTYSCMLHPNETGTIETTDAVA